MITPRPTQRRVLAHAAAALAVGLVLAGCSAKPGETTSSGNDSEPVTMAGVFCICFTNAYVAYEKGFFAEEGIDVKPIVMTKSGADTFQALAGGDAQFALNGLDAILRGQAQGIDVVSIGTVSPDFYGLSVRTEDADSITSAADLEGKKVSVSKIGSASWAFLQQLLDGAGLTDKDVEIVQLGGIDTTMAGLKNGTVDAAITWEPGTSQGTTQGFSTVVLDALNPQDHEQVFGTTESVSMTLATTQSFIDARPEAAKGAVRALDKADAWIAEHSPQEVADTIAPLAQGIDPEVLVASLENTMQSLPESSAVSSEAYASTTEILRKNGILDEVPPLETAFYCDVAVCE